MTPTPQNKREERKEKLFEYPQKRKTYQTGLQEGFAEGLVEGQRIKIKEIKEALGIYEEE